VTKVYFPPLVIPLAAAGGVLLDFVISSAILLVTMLFNGIGWSLNLLAAPLLVIFLAFVALGERISDGDEFSPRYSIDFNIMRLTEAQQEAIRTSVASVLGAESRIWLFGSRVDDSKRGGDIDLLIETDATLPNRTASLCRLEGRLAKSLGERKIDILLKDARTPEVFIHRIAKEGGVLL
jgi:predicted nucleotidyltransferase